MSQPATAAPRKALLFPGQGSQTSDMRDVVAEYRPDLLERSRMLVGEDPFDRVNDGTRFAQPALYCASLACWERSGRSPADVFAGHSLGELAALAAAGWVDDADGLRLAVVRGRLMQEAADDGPPSGMLAILGGDSAARALAVRFELTIANDNAPGQVVLSGPLAGLKEAGAAGRAAGVKTMALRVNGGFHSQAMVPAVAPYRAALAEATFTPTGVPVFSSTEARPFDDVRGELAAALIRPVRWRQTLWSLKRRGIATFLETGPGRVLTGLVRRTLEDVTAEVLDGKAVHA
jgi:[acyl-carrier-protein] S-malonyltransferase